MEKLIEDWRIVVSGDGYTPPELSRFHLQGIDTSIPEGEPRKMTSSPLVGEEITKHGRVVITRSGSRYRLGTAECEVPAFLGCMRIKHPWTPLG